MEKLKVISESTFVSLNDLTIDLAQVRTENVGKGIQDLAHSIERIGLLEPIVVFPGKEKGKYEILAGQRRFLACKTLGWEKINARIIERPSTSEEAKAISLHENWLREDISKKDEIQACLFLWKRYKNIAFIVDELGLPAHKVRQNLKFHTLCPELQKMVDDGLDLDTAVRAQEAADAGGDGNSEAVKYAIEMKGMSGQQRKRVVQKKKENPDEDTDEIIENAKGGDMIIQTYVILSTSTHQALKKYADNENLNIQDAGASLIEESLVSKGFINSN